MTKAEMIERIEALNEWEALMEEAKAEADAIRDSLKAEMMERAGKNFSGGTWNCALFIYAVDEKGKFRIVGYDISFLTAEAITSNLHKIDPKKNPKLRKVKSGVDYKYEL